VSFRWIDHADDYVRATGREAIAVLRPRDAQRLARWQSVLASYQTGVVETTPWANSCVAVLSDDVAPAAAAYAKARKCPLRRCRDLDEVLTTSREASSITLFARPDQLRARDIASLNACIEVPWGVVPATDLHAASFAVAKLLARARDGGAIGWISGAFGRLGRLATQESHQTAISQALTQSLLRDDGLRALVILAHGEGAHLNLQDVVVCGAVDDETQRGRRFEVCRTGACKRVHAPHVEAFAVHEVRAASLVILSCNGFAVAGEQYPTCSSLVGGALDGFARSLVVTDRTVLIQQHEASTVAELLLAGAGLHDVVAIKNEGHALDGGPRPYLLVGDPLLERATRPIDSRPCDSAVVELSDERAYRGRHRVLLLDAATRCTDRGADLSQLESLVSWLTARCAFAERFEQAIAILYLGGDASEQVRSELEKLATLRKRVGECLLTLAQIAQRANSSGVWPSDVVPRIRTRLVQHVEQYGFAMAELFAAAILAGPVEQTCTYGLSLASRSEGECERCATPTLVERRAPLGGGLAICMVSCPVCGFLGAYPEDAAPLTLDVTPHVMASMDIAIDVGAATARADLATDRSLVLRARDKGRGRTFLIATGGDELASIVTEAPADLTPDLHSFHAMEAHNMAFRIARVRRPAVAERMIETSA
jgi:hypothetical protein